MISEKPAGHGHALVVSDYDVLVKYRGTEHLNTRVSFSGSYKMRKTGFMNMLEVDTFTVQALSD